MPSIMALHFELCVVDLRSWKPLEYVQNKNEVLVGALVDTTQHSDWKGCKWYVSGLMRHKS